MTLDPGTLRQGDVVELLRADSWNWDQHTILRVVREHGGWTVETTGGMSFHCCEDLAGDCVRLVPEGRVEAV